MKNIIIKSIALLLLPTLIGCGSARISPEQMSTVRDSELAGGPEDLLGGSDTTSSETAPGYSMTGGGGL